MNIDGFEDATLTRKIEKREMKKKKREANAVPDMVEDDQLNKMEKKKRKKDKRKAEMYTEGTGDKNAIRGVTDCTIPVPDLVEDRNQTDKAENKKKKDKKKSEVGSESSKAKVREKDFADVMDNYQKKEKKKDKRNPEVSLETNSAKADDNNRIEKDKSEKKKKKKKVSGEDVNGDTVKDKSAFVEVVGNTLNVDTNVSETEKKKKKKVKEKTDNREKSEAAAVEVVQKTKNADIIVSEKVEKKHKTNIAERNVNNQIEKDRSEKKKKKKKVRSSEDVSVDTVKDKSASVEVMGKTLNSDNNVSKTEKKKKKKVEEKVDNKEKGVAKAVEVVEKTTNADINVSKKVEKKRKREKDKGKDLKDELATHSARKRSEGSEIEGDKMSNNDKEPSAVENNVKDSKPNKKKKKVSFSNYNEVFPSEGGIVQGKRFSPEEDKAVKQAVFDYIEAHDLGDEGLTMVLNCKSHSKIRNCWKEIGLALPHRPYVAVYDRAHSLFERDETRTYTSDELEIIKKYHAEHGAKWRPLADAMGKHRRHIKDFWRRTKLTDTKKGRWSQEEYQKLFDLVNVDLRAKVNQEKKSKHGMLKDNISWTAISDTLASRNYISCCLKWYNQLASSMVKEGEWADSDDYRLVDALYTLDACCIEDVNWDCLLEHRSGDVCLKRWKQMTNHIGENGKKIPFADQVEILSNRYCAELLEAREIWDNKPVVP